MKSKTPEQKFFPTLLQVSVVFICVFIALSQRKAPRSKFSDDSFSNESSDFDSLAEEIYPESEAGFEAYLDIFVRNANLNQPLLQAKDHAMPTNEFRHLQECLREHPMRFHNVNDDNTFNGTRGFLLSFNERGIAEMESSEMFTCLKEYFRRYRLPDTNGWVLNMVWADIPDFKKELTIQRHTDDAIVLNYTGSKKIMPFQTNVLYVFVPEGMEGGQLEAWDYDAHPMSILNGPQAKVSPAENRMAFFRGDAQHQVRSYKAPLNDKLRASLVLEQYNIPAEYEKYVTDWHWRDHQNGDMM
ncbi:unnamed protein product [Agarophyton chilense]